LSNGAPPFALIWPDLRPYAATGALSGDNQRSDVELMASVTEAIPDNPLGAGAYLKLDACWRMRRPLRAAPED
jgi:hypothetical protein